MRINWATKLLVFSFSMLVLILAVKIGVLDRTSKNYVDAAVPAIAAHWSKTELLDRARPELLASKSRDEWNNAFALYRLLGRLRSYQGSEGEVSVTITRSLGISVTASYVAKANFEAGPAEKYLFLIRELKDWRILGFQVSSTALSEKMFMAGLKDDSPRQKPPSSTTSTYVSRGPDLHRLYAIEFPQNLTEETARKYISEVIFASAGQNTRSVEDPQVKMLAKVGEDNIDLLLEFAQNDDNGSRYYCNLAVIKLATNRSKIRILSELPANRGLIKAVIKNGWEREAKETLVTELRERPRNIPYEWVEALCGLKDPSVYNDLIEYFVNCDSKYRIYQMISVLPGIRLEEAIMKAWNKVKYERNWDTIMMSTLVIHRGDKDALEILATKLKSGMLTYFYRNKVRQVLLDYTEAKGTNDEIIEWYKKNRPYIYFDTGNNKFRVNKDATIVPSS